MDTIKLPKLRKIDPNKPKKKKILLLSDDLRMHSGIANVSRDIVFGTLDEFDWVQLGAAVKHPQDGQMKYLKREVLKMHILRYMLVVDMALHRN